MPIKVHFGQEAIFGFVLTLTRVSSALLLMPLPGFRDAVQMGRVVLVVGITFALMPVWPAVHFDSLSGGQFLLAVIGETACGLLLGLAIAFLNGAFQLAAQTISMQAGFSFASTFDPSSQADSTVFQVMSQMLAGVLFFTLGVHRQLLRLLAHSFDVFSPAKTVLNGESVHTIGVLGAMMFASGFRFGLPVVALLLLAEIAIALLNRLHAQLYLITLTFPAKTALSFAFLSALLLRWPALYEQTARRIFEALGQVGLR